MGTPTRHLRVNQEAPSPINLWLVKKKIGQKGWWGVQDVQKWNGPGAGVGAVRNGKQNGARKAPPQG